MDIFFITLSTLGFISGIVWLVVSAVLIARLVGKILPLLGETREHVRDLGDLTANTIGRASDTMEMVELRVSQTMGQAAQGGASATRQALGVGTALAGLYMASRVASLLRDQLRSPRKRKR